MISTPPHHCLSHTDLELITTMAAAPSLGRFLTMTHKRKRKKLTTRSLNANYAILDDIQHGQVQCILNKCSLWSFNAFALETAAGGRSLPVLCVHLFHFYGLFEYFQLDVASVWKLFSLIEEGYHNTNPYHNSIHATDVTQAMHCFLQENTIKKYMSPVEIMASLLGAVAHDLDHPGVNQPFLIATSNHLATLYDNMSVLENHHWRSAIGCLLESGIAQQLHSVYRTQLEQQIRLLILATDITRQQEFIQKLAQQNFDLSLIDDRHFILQIALKCADISNPTRPWLISKMWSIKVCEEFFRQGDYERKLSLPITALCDRYTTSIPKIQTGFIQFVVSPLFIEWNRFLQSPLSKQMMRILYENQSKWEQELVKQQQEQHEQQQPQEMTDIIECCYSNEDDIVNVSNEQLIKDDFIPRKQQQPISASRRHSVPFKSVRCTEITRRESLPLTDILNNNNKYAFDTSINTSSCGGDSKISSLGISERNDSPLSAEQLLPSPTIASITHMTTPRHLTRQQTFPPVQPYTRHRYLSTTTETIDEQTTTNQTTKWPPPTTAAILLIKTSDKRQHKENMDPSTKRRGSAPPLIAEQQILIAVKRRGSMPPALVVTEPQPARHHHHLHHRHKLRRRSSGGPEHVLDLWRFQQQVRRRGSLPIDCFFAT